MPEVPTTKKSKLSRQAFSGAVSGARSLNQKISRRTKIWGGIAVAILLFSAYAYTVMNVVPPQGNSLYGICRVYIERHLQFPNTLKIIEFNQRIPRGENPRAPRAITYDITFSSIDGFGQDSLNTLTCDFKLDDKLMNTPWNGIVLYRTLMNGRSDHGWADVYYPPNQKNPRAGDDVSEELENFFPSIPIIMKNPPDLRLPLRRLQYMRIIDLQNL